MTVSKRMGDGRGPLQDLGLSLRPDLIADVLKYQNDAAQTLVSTHRSLATGDLLSHDSRVLSKVGSDESKHVVAHMRDWGLLTFSSRDIHAGR